MRKHKMHTDEKGHYSPAQSKVAKKMRGESPKHHGKKHHGKGKVEKVMHEFGEGKLHSGSKKGPIVKSRAQAIAIGMSEARKTKGKK